MATMKTLNGYGFNATELNGKTSDSYLQKTDTASDTSKLGGKAPEYYIQPRNLLDNSDFRNPVNQRGATSYRGTSYTIDRWWMQTDTGTASIGDNGLTLATNDSTSCKIVQYVEKLDINKVYTFVIKDTSENVYLIHSVPNGRNEEKTSFGSMIANTTNINDKNASAFSISLDLGTTITLAWAALYEGSYTADTLPPYVPKGYAAELAECRRYFVVLSGNLIGIAHPYTTNDVYMTLYMPTKMRRKPTVELTYLRISNNNYITDSDASISSVDNMNTHNTAITFFANTSSTLTLGRLYGVSTTGGIYISADL